MKRNRLYISTDEATKLHNCLMTIIERGAKGKATPEEVAILPEVAQVVIELAKYHS